MTKEVFDEFNYKGEEIFTKIREKEEQIWKLRQGIAGLVTEYFDLVGIERKKRKHDEGGNKRSWYIYDGFRRLEKKHLNTNTIMYNQRAKKDENNRRDKESIVSSKRDHRRTPRGIG